MADTLYTPDWVVVGGPALTVDMGNGWGVPTTHQVTIEKITATQIVVSNGKRYKKPKYLSDTKQLKEVGGSYYTNDLISTTDPRLPMWEKQAKLRDTKNEVKQAIRSWESSPDIEKAAALKEALNGWIVLTSQVNDLEEEDANG